MNYCKVCGRKLELTPEYDMCIECQGKQHRTFTLPYNDGVNANHTEMTAQQKKAELLELYQKAIRMMICVPQNETYHYVVRYTDDVEFNKLLNRIKALEEEMK